MVFTRCCYTRTSNTLCCKKLINKMNTSVCLGLVLCPFRRLCRYTRADSGIGKILHNIYIIVVTIWQRCLFHKYQVQGYFNNLFYFPIIASLSLYMRAACMCRSVRKLERKSSMGIDILLTIIV